MKIIKKIISMFLSIIILLALTTLCGIFVLRNLLSGSTLVDLAFKGADVTKTSYTEVINNLTDGQLPEEIDKYVDEKELKENIEGYITEWMKYYGGASSSAPSVDNLKEQFHDIAKQYEKETGQTVKYDEIDKAFDSLDEEIEENIGVSDDKEVKMAFGFIYSDKLIVGAVVAIIVCLLLKLLISKNIFDLIKSVVIIAVFNTFGNFGFGIALEKLMASESNKDIQNIVETIKLSFNKIAYISIIVAVVFIVILIIAKVMKNKANSDSNKDNNEIKSIINDDYLNLEDNTNVNNVSLEEEMGNNNGENSNQDLNNIDKE